MPYLCSARTDLPPITVSPLFPACAPGHFGADCRLQCQCQNGGTCDRFSGCICPSGWHGVHCEKSGMLKTGDLSSNTSLPKSFPRRVQMWWIFSPFRYPYCEGQQPRVTLTSVRVFWEDSKSEIECERHKRKNWERM